jgi:hypothetical protein
VIVITHEISSSLLAITSVGSSCNSLSERVALLLLVVVVVGYFVSRGRNYFQNDRKYFLPDRK